LKKGVFMADDNITTAVTGAAKGGIIGVLVGAVAVFAAITLGAGFVGALGSAIGIGSGAGPAMGALFSGGALTWLAGITAAGVGVAYGTVPALLGGAIGLAKAGDRINHKAAHAGRAAHSHQQMQEKARNDGIIEGTQQAYQMLAPQFEQREQAAYQKGQQDIVEQIQQHAMKEMEQQQKQVGAAIETKPDAKGFAAKCEAKCTVSKADMIKTERQQQANAVPQLGA